MRLDCERKVYEFGNAWCESCGATPELHISIFDGGTYWCLGCALQDGMITEDEETKFEHDNLKVREVYLINALHDVQTVLRQGEIT